MILKKMAPALLLEEILIPLAAERSKFGTWIQFWIRKKKRMKKFQNYYVQCIIIWLVLIASAGQYLGNIWRQAQTTVWL